MTTAFEIFFPSDYGGNIMSEVACESNQMCNQNQVCFKAFFSSWLAFTTTLVPETAPKIIPKLQASAQGAAQQCSGEADGLHCGRRWYQNTWDGTSGLEEQMSAISAFSSTLITQPGMAPVTANSGGTSTSNPNAGTGPKVTTTPLSKQNTEPIKLGDKIGASIFTGVFALALGSLMVWICLD